MPVGKKEIFVTFRIDKSDYFKRDGADVHTEADISVSQALLGGTIRIQGIYEDHTLQVGKNTFTSCAHVFVCNVFAFADYARNIFAHEDTFKWERHQKGERLRSRRPLRCI